MEISILNILVKGFWQGEESQYIQELAHLMVKNFGRPIKVDKNQHHIQKQPFKVIWNLRGVHLDMSTPLMIQSKESSE